jgi:ADP-ribose pyrophosphatase
MDSEPLLTDVEEHWPVASSSDLHRDDWVVALRADRIRRPGTDGPDVRRLVLEHPGAVVVLAIDEQERVCCLAQYRHPAGRRFVELPAGLCDEPGEEPLAVAQRELQEEAGLRADSWTYLTSAYSSPGISAELMHYFVARELSPADRADFDLEHEEADMTLFWAPFADLYDATLAGRLTDAPLVLAVLLAHARGQATPGGG